MSRGVKQVSTVQDGSFTVLDRAAIVRSADANGLGRLFSPFSTVATIDVGKVLDGAPFINKLEQQDDSIRLYVEDGATAIPLILRALDAGDVPLGSIELNRPSLDDVFLTKTGRSLRES